jgi:hypothetical protein
LNLLIQAWVCAVLAAGAASAAERAEPVRIEYRAPAGCPNTRAFTWMVGERVSRPRAARPGEVARLFVVEVETTDEGAVGHLTIREPDGSEASRSLRASDCAELADALALIVALAVDPRASTGPLSEPPSAGDQPPPPAAEPTPKPAAASSDRPSVGFESAAELIVASGMAPGSLLGVKLSVGLVGGEDRATAPAARLAVMHAPQRSFSVAGATMSVRWWAAGLELCPLALPLGEGLTTRPCGQLEWGRLWAVGSNTVGGREARGRWFASGALAKLVWAPSGQLLVEADLAAVAPLAADRYLIGSTVVHQLPVVAGRAGIGLGMHIP